MPSSWAWSMIAWASPGGVREPKFIVPRQRRLTDRPERPRCVYSMSLLFHVPAPSVAAAHPAALLRGSVAAGAEDRVVAGDLVAIRVAVRVCGLTRAGLGCLDGPALAQRGDYLIGCPAVLHEVR